MDRLAVSCIKDESFRRRAGCWYENILRGNNAHVTGIANISNQPMLPGCKLLRSDVMLDLSVGPNTCRHVLSGRLCRGKILHEVSNKESQSS